MDPTQHHFQGRRIAILGAGWLGRRIAEQAIQYGMEVSTLTRNAKTTAALRNIGVHNPVIAQLHSNLWHEQLSRDQDFVVNCVSSAGNDLEGYRQSYVDGNQSILEWAGGDHPANFAYTSSTSVFPQTDGESVDETSTSAEVSKSGQSLLEAEDLLRRQSPFACTTILRLSGLYGPGRHYLLNLIREGCEELPGPGDFLLNLLHIEDACSAVWAALGMIKETGGQGGRGKVETYNVTDGNPATKAEIVEWLASQLGRPRPRFNPEANPRRSPIRRPGDKVPNRRIDNRKIRDALGWEPSFPCYRDGYADPL